MIIVNSFVNDNVKRIVGETTQHGRLTISSRLIQTLVCLFFPNTLLVKVQKLSLHKLKVNSCFKLNLKKYTFFNPCPLKQYVYF